MDVPISQILGFICAFLYGSFFEWFLHKYLMHQPRWGYAFRAHALVHHGLFRTGPGYFLSDSSHLRKVRFAWWNAPLIIVLHAPVIRSIEILIGANIMIGALTAIALYYVLYEYLHYCMHIPKARRIEQTAWFLWLDAHHHMHHKQFFRNLHVVLPLADLAFGTLIRARDRRAVPDRRQGTLQVETLLS